MNGPVLRNSDSNAGCWMLDAGICDARICGAASVWSSPSAGIQEHRQVEITLKTRLKAELQTVATMGNAETDRKSHLFHSNNDQRKIIL